jgi:uncharacterized membrane protein
VLIEAVVLFVLGCMGKLRILFKKSLAYVLIGVMATSICRIITVSLWLSFYDSYADSVFNRLTWILFVLTFMVLVFGWIETIHVKYPAPTESFVPVVKWVMLGIAIALFLTQLITLIVYLVTRASANVPPGTYAAYNANIWIFTVFLLALSLAFLIYGIVLLRNLNRGMTNRHSVGVVDSRNIGRQRAAYLKVSEKEVLLYFFFF